MHRRYSLPPLPNHSSKLEAIYTVSAVIASIVVSSTRACRAVLELRLYRSTSYPAAASVHLANATCRTPTTKRTAKDENEEERDDEGDTKTRKKDTRERS